MKKIQPVKGYILSGEDKFYLTADAAKAASVRAERLRMIRDGVGPRWHSDPVGALLADESLLQSVAALEYQHDEKEG